MSLLAAMSATAQTNVLRINVGDTIVTYRLADIKEIVFDTEEEHVDTTLFHSFNGYLTVTSAYFTDSYYGDQAQLAVWKTSQNEYIVTFSDPVWGEAEFGNVIVGRTLAAEGTIKMANQQGGGVKEYAATLSGAMTTPVITVPTVMGGTTITFHVGEAPMHYRVSGRHKGDVSVMVGGQFGPYTAEGITHNIVANGDGTISVTIPEYVLTGTVMGDLTLGSYTVSNIAWNEERGAFFRDYSADDTTFHLKVEKDGAVTMDGDYNFNALGTLEVKLTETGVSIENNFQPGRMPFPIKSEFIGN